MIWGIRNESTGLWPSGIDSRTLQPTNNFSGFGAGFDSFPEYLLKSYIMFGFEIEFSRFSELIKYVKYFYSFIYIKLKDRIENMREWGGQSVFPAMGLFRFLQM